MNKVSCSAKKSVANSFPPSSLTTVNNCDKFGDSHPPKWLIKNSGSRGAVAKQCEKFSALCDQILSFATVTKSAVPRGFPGF